MKANKEREEGKGEGKAEQWKVYNARTITRGCKSWGISRRHATKVNTATRPVPGGHNLYSAFLRPLIRYLFFSNSFIPVSRLPLSPLSDHKFSSFSAAAIRPAARSTRFRYQGYWDFTGRLPISMLVDYDLFVKPCLMIVLAWHTFLVIVIQISAMKMGNFNMNRYFEKYIHLVVTRGCYFFYFKADKRKLIPLHCAYHIQLFKNLVVSDRNSKVPRVR